MCSGKPALAPVSKCKELLTPHVFLLQLRIVGALEIPAAWLLKAETGPEEIIDVVFWDLPIS